MAYFFLAIFLAAAIVQGVRQDVDADHAEASLGPIEFGRKAWPEQAMMQVENHSEGLKAETPWVVAENLKYEEVQKELLKYLDEHIENAATEFPKFQKKQHLRDALEKLPESNSTCQLGSLLKDLTKACKTFQLGQKGVASFKLWRRREGGASENPFASLSDLDDSEKDCATSAQELFLYGSDMVKALRVPVDQIWAQTLPTGTMRIVQSLWVLKKWLVPLATAKSAALLWAGFWNDPNNTQSRTSKDKLSKFAKLTAHQTVHPGTRLGQLIESHGDLNNCYVDENHQELARNMWSFVSMSFVFGMRKTRQRCLVST